MLGAPVGASVRKWQSIRQDSAVILVSMRWYQFMLWGGPQSYTDLGSSSATY